VEKVFKNIAEGQISVGNPRRIRLGDFDNDLKKMAVSGWRKVGRDRGVWKLILKGAQVPAWIVEPVENINNNNKIRKE
jgi:hypothetical protein